MVKRQLRLVFATDLITQPIIYNLSREFGLLSSIQRASLEDNKGLVVVELEGSDADIDKGVSWVRERGVEVEPVETAEAKA